jgi:hypothetical protein
MNVQMTENVPSKMATKHGECTDFQMHKSQMTIFDSKLSKRIYDYSEHRLTRHIEKVLDSQQKLILIALLHDYVCGDVAIAWKRGQPIWIKVTKA